MIQRIFIELLKKEAEHRLNPSDFGIFRGYANAGQMKELVAWFPKSWTVVKQAIDQVKHDGCFYQSREALARAVTKRALGLPYAFSRDMCGLRIFQTSVGQASKCA